jgi:hypothetical protein
MKLVIKTNAMKGVLETLQKSGNDSLEADLLQKAFHKYIRKIPKKSGKGWNYIYAETFQKPLAALKTFFGFKEDTITEDYEKNNIKTEYGADKKTFAAHVLEYFSNKVKWDQFFAKKENREKTTKPQKMSVVKQSSNEKIGIDNSGQGELVFEEKTKTEDNKLTLNRSLMRKVYGIYNKAEDNEYEREKRQDNAQSRSGELPAGTPAVRAGESEGNVDQYVPGGGDSDDGGQPVQPVVDTGGRSGRNVRVTKGQAKEIREACLKLLSEKTNEQMTEADKALLRQYEGAGGLGDEDASVHGTLYELDPHKSCQQGVGHREQIRRSRKEKRA